MRRFKRLGHLVLLLFVVVSRLQLTRCDGDGDGAIDTPFQLLYFKIPEGDTFHPNLKYPPFQRCVLPDRLHKKSILTKPKPGEDLSKRWRLYWSRELWGAYYFENGDGTVTWEYLKENGARDKHYWVEEVLPILCVIIWIIVIFTLTLMIYPMVSMVIFRCLYFIWKIITCKLVRAVIRRIIIKNARFKRDHILRVFQDAGHRPPFYRYSLPLFCRRDPREAIPKELDETDEEFWDSDEELATTTTTTTATATLQSKNKPTPEFTPEYPVVLNESASLSDETFSYLLKIKQHGMFAVWIDGVSDINLEEITASKDKQKPFSLNN